MKIYNLEEYGSNFNPAIYDPKKFIQDQENTYDNLGFKNLIFLLNFFSSLFKSKKTIRILFRRRQFSRKAHIQPK